MLEDEIDPGEAPDKRKKTRYHYYQNCYPSNSIPLRLNRTPSSSLVPRIKRSSHTFPPITHRPHHLHFSLFSATSNIRLPSSPIVNNTSPHCQTASSLRTEQLPFTVPLSPQAAISVTLPSPFFT
ncbi:unnamed protein product [Vicia faba]|uniref:Uncharacterized protein n=1 Tax=Vicia faba TaxID=3906 RepID=A0AAV1AI11_VICFA|nr:unnamed protein product [Vicia faba]